MEDLANQIVDIIKDYRIDSGIAIDSDHVIRWVNQFDKDDREFILSELLHFLPNAYISQNEAKSILKNVFDYFKVKYDHVSAIDFLSHAKFLSCQGPLKSQTVTLPKIRTI